jgi:sigma-B regulation protein RsbU (phosphoserine phosphatase)
MKRPLHVLLVDESAKLPADIATMLRGEDYQVTETDNYATALATARKTPIDAALLVTPPAAESAPGSTESDEPGGDAFAGLLRACEVQGTAAIVIGDRDRVGETDAPHLFSFAPPSITLEEIKGRLSMVAHYHRQVRSMERDLDNMQRLFRQLNIQFTEVDQEMRLAGRLQSAFLPHELPPIGPLRFSALYRPATFVSGDIYDVARIDEDHVAFYVADAVGHGMAASLLTMFIKNAVVSKIIHDDSYEVLDPDQTLQRLNRRLVDQQLPNSQFVTACFGLVNIRTLEMQYARAGHPYPLHCTTDGSISELKSPGGLLGLFEEEEFPVQRVTLRPGEKVILYSDGVELAFPGNEGRDDELNYYRKAFFDLVQRPAGEFTLEFAKLLDGEAGSLNPQDDVTLLVLDVAAQSS